MGAEACLGNTGDLEHYSQAEMVQGKCLENYDGPLCFKCPNGFVKLSSKGLCQSCDNNPLFFIKMAIVVLFVIAYVFIQIRFMLKDIGAAYISILFKQIITHFQQISIISVLDLGWTPDFRSYFNFQSYFSFVSEELFNFDCLC